MQLLYAGIFLNGMGVVLLGPLLPRLASSWSLTDTSAGTLLAAQFLGSSLGTIFVLRRTRLALLIGSLLSCLGLSLLALLLRAPAGRPLTFPCACLSLFIYGFGLGHAMTAINLSIGESAEGRAARLSLGNGLWSIGAILSPMLLALALAYVSLTLFLCLFGGLFAVTALALPAFRIPLHEHAAPHPQLPQPAALTFRILVPFATILFLYAGAETCFSGWLSTFAHRAAATPETVSPIYTSVFWCGVAGGRLLGSGLFRRFNERQAIAVLLSGAALASLGLVLSHAMLPLLLAAAGCGALLGPVFPAALASLLNWRPTPRQAGVALACAGFGAALLPFLLGLIAQRLSSLRIALALPIACLLLMLLLTRGLRSPGTAAT